MTTPNAKSLSDELAALREQLAALTDKIAKLEGAEAPSAPVAAAAAPVPAEIDEETLLALSAAVAAYLGKRASIRTVRLLGSTAWAQQGRVSIQASHRLNVQHHRVR